jgi:hypothetical protein
MVLIQPKISSTRLRLLADDVARVAQRSSVQRRAASAAVIGSDVWGNVQPPTSRDEIGGIISLVRTKVMRLIPGRF